ncbi:MAG: TIGR02444 family protein [Pseudohongiellaceae bacterium]
MTNSSQNFWGFSVELYQQEGIAPACLKLQNKFGLDVNLVLLCFWYGHTTGSMGPEALQASIKFSDQWRMQVVNPLRQSRQWMKVNQPKSASHHGGFNRVREEIKSVELAAEKHQQECLQDIVWQESMNDEDKGVAGIDANLEALLKHLNITECDTLNAALAVIRRSVV